MVSSITPPSNGPAPPPFILLTGASGAIGQACARALAGKDTSFALQYHHSATAVQSLAEEIRARGGQALTLQADLANPTQAQTLVAQAAASLGRPGILIHAAGTLLEKPVAFTSESEFEHLLNLHAVSAAFLAKALFRHLREAGSGGRLIFLSSMAGLLGLGNALAYAASKGALTGLVKTLALECARFGTTVNAVAPGYVESPMTTHHDPQRKTKTLETIPLGRYAQATEVAALVAFLCSPQAAYLTGQLIALDGGMGCSQ